MSARDKLFEAMAGGWSLTQNETAELNQVIDNYAHELAEQQRQEMKAPGQSYDASRWNRCVCMTADLIDPEKP